MQVGGVADVGVESDVDCGVEGEVGEVEGCEGGHWD